MDTSTLRCPSCAAAIPPSRPSACAWCGAPLPAAAARAAPPSRAAEFSALPRELPPMAAPVRRGAGGIFAALLFVAVLIALAFVLFSVRNVPPPPDAPPPRPAPAEPSTPVKHSEPVHSR